MLRSPFSWPKIVLSALLAPLAWGCSTSNTVPFRATPVLNLLVGNTRGNNVVRFDIDTGAFIGEFIPAGSGGLSDPDTLLLGPDANGDGRSDLYVASGALPGNAGGEGASSVLRYDGVTGAFIDAFVQDDPATATDETGGLHRPYGMAFGPDGDLYVSSFRTDEILVYDGDNGAFKSVFATGNAAAGGLNGPNGLLFAPDGSLLVTTQGSVAGSFDLGLPSQLLRYDLVTATATVFASPEPSPDSFGFVSLLGMAIGPDGDLYVSDFANDIRIYNLETGVQTGTLATNYTDTIPSGNFIGGLAFTPDGLLFSVGFDNRDGANSIGAILRYDSATRQPFPTAGNTGALFTPPNANLQRPIGVLIYQR
ncbi:MAG: hypothetical protein OHK0012_03360 [Synechococcales cyanobacterium]